MELVEGFVGSALYDLALLDDKNLVGSADNGRNFRVAGNTSGTTKVTALLRGIKFYGPPSSVTIVPRGQAIPVAANR
jgi:uncharacterized protein YhbP (UPF0306 family)